jgi:hypothetical protein
MICSTSAAHRLGSFGSGRWPSACRACSAAAKKPPTSSVLGETSAPPTSRAGVGKGGTAGGNTAGQLRCGHAGGSFSRSTRPRRAGTLPGTFAAARAATIVAKLATTREDWLAGGGGTRESERKRDTQNRIGWRRLKARDATHRLARSPPARRWDRACGFALRGLRCLHRHGRSRTDPRDCTS